ncbi:MAG: HAD family hydrolase [Thermodesulfobacteriota bacterium]
MIISRNDPCKPSPQGVLAAAEKWKITPGRIAVVGDYIFDIQAGKAAGAVTIFLQHPGPDQTIDTGSDFTVFSLTEVVPLLRLPNR